MIKDAYELNELLVDKFRKRIVTDPYATLGQGVEGTLDSQKFCITFIKNNFLLISTSLEDKEVLEKLLPTLKEVMNGQEPICSYDLQNKGSENYLPTIEWDVKNPTERIKSIVNGRAFSNGEKIHNLKLYNSKNIEDYFETKQEKEERIKNSRIYGIDPGSIKDVEVIDNLSEIDLFLVIDALGGHIWRCQHDMAHGRIDPIDLTEERYALEYLVYKTKKFGVEIPEPEIGKHIVATPSYNAWYNFYSNHFHNVLTNEEWAAFEQAKLEGKDTSSFMPTGNWRDLLEKQAKKTKK